MLTHGSALPKQRDIVNFDLDGPVSFTLIDINRYQGDGLVWSHRRVSGLASIPIRSVTPVPLRHISRQSSFDYYWGWPQGTPHRLVSACVS
jgi:hypothetical protein